MPDGRAVEAPLKGLRRGGYTVRWQVLSDDGHVSSGVFTFGFRAAAPSPTEAFGASGPTTTEHVVRWLYFLALALLLGALVFRLVVLPGPLPLQVERRFYATAAIGVVATIHVGILAFVLRAEDALQVPFTRLLYGDLSPIAGGTRFGIAFIAMTLGYALVAALLFLAWLTERRALLVGALVVGLGFASGLSLSGHSAVDAGASWKSQLADWIHLSSAMLWLGGLVQLGVVVWPLAPELRRRAFLGFSRLATALIGLLLLAGVYLSILRLPHLRDLWQTGYGHVLLVKLGLVALALAWGAAHKFVAAPRVSAASGRLRRSLVGESIVGMAVLLAAAVLVDSQPPPQAPAQPPRAVSR
jgi:copper transport protein